MQAAHKNTSKSFLKPHSAHSTLILKVIVMHFLIPMLDLFTRADTQAHKHTSAEQRCTKQTFWQIWMKSTHCISSHVPESGQFGIADGCKYRRGHGKAKRLEICHEKL